MRGRFRGLGESGRSSRRATDALRVRPLDPLGVDEPTRRSPIVEGKVRDWEGVAC